MKKNYPKNKKKIIVTCFYCEPSRIKNIYLEHVEDVLEENGNVLQIVFGDFNTDLSKKISERV